QKLSLAVKLDANGLCRAAGRGQIDFEDNRLPQRLNAGVLFGSSEAPDLKWPSMRQVQRAKLGVPALEDLNMGGALDAVEKPRRQRSREFQDGRALVVMGGKIGRPATLLAGAESLEEHVT